MRGDWIVNKFVVVVSYDLDLDHIDRSMLDPDQGDKAGITASWFYLAGGGTRCQSGHCESSAPVQRRRHKATQLWRGKMLPSDRPRGAQRYCWLASLSSGWSSELLSGCQRPASWRSCCPARRRRPPSPPTVPS